MLGSRRRDLGWVGTSAEGQRELNKVGWVRDVLHNTVLNTC